LPGCLRRLVVHPNYIVLRVLAKDHTVRILGVKHVARRVP
jgi:plasmid stabilization system protein ParE